MGTIRAKNVREAARALGRFSWDDLCCRLGSRVQVYADRKRLKLTVRDFLRRGEIVRLDGAMFEYRAPARPRTRIDVIWHLVRSHRTFTTDDIERLSGAARATVLEYLACLARLGAVRRERKPGTWILIKDLGPETPVNTRKCKKLQAVRKRKAAA